MGSIKLRGSVYWIRFNRNGKRHEESSHSNKRGAAVKLLQLREGDVAAGKPVTAHTGRIMVGELLDDLLTEYKVQRRRSLDDVEHRVNKFVRPYFGDRRCVDITTATVNAFVASRQDAKPSPAAATINRELSALKRAFSLAVRAGKVLHAPYIPLLAERNTRTGFFSDEQLATVIADLPAEVQPVIRFAAVTGWRIPSEVLTLQWKDVDRAAGVLRLEPGTTKNSDGRTFIIGPLADLKAVLDEQWAIHEALKKTGKIVPSVFHREGEPIAGFRRSWLTACKAAGCPGRVPHDLRRTAIRAMVRAGISEHTAMLMSGHKTASVFRRYSIVSEQDLAEAAVKLAKVSGQ